MPKIEPVNQAVNWNKEEGTLGVVGVAPWATIEFCKSFYSKIKAVKDWHYPRVIVDINSKIPSRGRYFQLGERDPSPYIAETINELSIQGATVAVVPCNTAHILFDKWAFESPIPVPNILKETLRLASDSGATSITPLTSTSLAKKNLYGKLTKEFDLQCVNLTPEEQIIIDNVIQDIKMFGEISNENYGDFESLMINPKFQDTTIIFGCTELSLLGDFFHKKDITTIDSNSALAEAALRYIYNRD
jgi:aspartate racemase